MDRNDLIARLRFARENMCLNCTYDDILEQAIEMIKGQDVTPEELERLKKCRHDCKIECLLKEYDRVKNERDALLKVQEPRLVTYEDFHSGREDGGEAIPCWKEARQKTRRSGWAVIVYGKMLADRETGVARYWTARPTEEQMQEEAWPGA